MTEGQVKYQTLMENQRHNLAMERYNERQARVSEREVAYKEARLPWETKLLNQQIGETEAKMQKTTGEIFLNAAKTFTEAFKAGSVLGALFA